MTVAPLAEVSKHLLALIDALCLNHGDADGLRGHVGGSALISAKEEVLMRNHHVAETVTKAARSQGRAMTEQNSRPQCLESLIRTDYERCHPDDTFDDLKRRAHFAKEDKGLFRDWLAIAERREQAMLATAIMICAA